MTLPSFLVAFEWDGVPLWSGTGTILKNTDAGGYPAVMSVRHMVTYAVSGTKGPYLVAYDHSGHVLGKLNTLDNAKTVEGYKVDGPVILSFDQGFPLNKTELKKIPGVEVAHTLSSAPLFAVFGGPQHGGIGVAPGDSGGGIYVKQNGQYKITAVIQADTPYFRGKYTSIESEQALPKNATRVVSDGRQYAVIRSQTGSIISSLGEGTIPHELMQISTNSTKFEVTDNVAPQAVGFGFSLGVATMISGLITTARRASDSGF
jgi:hypothetical protein